MISSFLEKTGRGNQQTGLIYFALLLITALAMNASYAGVCDVRWDGNKVAEGIRGRPLDSKIELKNIDGTINSEISVAQLSAFADAKVAVSELLNRRPMFVICDSKEPNAFAARNNAVDVVGVTVGMFKLVNGDRDMAAEVIGHEYAHLVRNHGQATRERETMVDLASLVLGIALDHKLGVKTGYYGLASDLTDIAGTLIARTYSRDQEREADELGFGYLVSAGFNPMGALRLAERMNSLGIGGVGIFFDRHPGWEERGSRFKNLIANNDAAKQLIARVGESTKLSIGKPESAVATQVAFIPSDVATDPQKSYAEGVAAWRSGDLSRALNAMKSAADAGMPEAQTYLGLAYKTGTGGVTRDEILAVRWYRMAAEQGDAFSQNELGSLYAEGRGGLPKDDTQAVRWIRAAAEQGLSRAEGNLATFYRTGRGGLPQDEVQAVQWYRKSAEKGNAAAQNNLSAMYAAGRGGLPKDDDQSTYWLKKAAEGGNAMAQVNLGSNYAYGNHGFPKDSGQAVYWFRKSAEQGNALGQGSLGSAYQNGLGGLPKDIEEAVQWFKKAADQGNQWAISRLKALGR